MRALIQEPSDFGLAELSLGGGLVVDKELVADVASEALRLKNQVAYIEGREGFLAFRTVVALRLDFLQNIEAQVSCGIFCEAA